LSFIRKDKKRRLDGSLHISAFLITAPKQTKYTFVKVCFNGILKDVGFCDIIN
jgi:hypothetical protein